MSTSGSPLARFGGIIDAEAGGGRLGPFVVELGPNLSPAASNCAGFASLLVINVDMARKERPNEGASSFIEKSSKSSSVFSRSTSTAANCSLQATTPASQSDFEGGK